MKTLFKLALISFLLASNWNIILAQDEGQPAVNDVSFFVRLVGKARADTVFTVTTTNTLTSAQYKVWPNMTIHVSVSGTTPDVSIVYQSALQKENGTLTTFVTESTTASVTGETRVILTSSAISNGPAVCEFVVTGVGSNGTANVKITLATAHPNK